MTSELFCRIVYINDIAKFFCGELQEAIILSHVSRTWRSSILSYAIPTWTHFGHVLCWQPSGGGDKTLLSAGRAAASRLETAPASVERNKTFFHLHVLAHSRFLWVIEALVRQGGIRSFGPTLPQISVFRRDLGMSVMAPNGTTIAIRPPLHAAVAAGNKQLVSLLLQHCRDDCSLELEGLKPPLVVAVEYSRVALIDMLCRATRDASEALQRLRFKHADGQHTTSTAKRQLLVADPEKVLSAAFFLVISTRRHDILSELVRCTREHFDDSVMKSVLLSRAEGSSNTLLHHAVAHSAPECLDMILRLASQFDTETMRWLIHEDVFTRRCSNPVTALELACIRKDAACLKLLLAAGSSPNDALDITIESNLHGMFEIILSSRSSLLDLNKKVRSKGLLEYAADRDRRLIIRQILQMPGFDCWDEVQRVHDLFAKKQFNKRDDVVVILADALAKAQRQ